MRRRAGRTGRRRPSLWKVPPPRPADSIHNRWSPPPRCPPTGTPTRQAPDSPEVPSSPPPDCQASGPPTPGHPTPRGPTPRHPNQPHTPPPATHPAHQHRRTNPMPATTGPDRNKVYGHRWRKLRAAILANNPPCWICGHPGADSLDHLQPVARGGDWYDPANLRPAHVECNSRRGSDTAQPPPRSRLW